MTKLICKLSKHCKKLIIYTYTYYKNQFYALFFLFMKTYENILYIYNTYSLCEKKIGTN